MSTEFDNLVGQTLGDFQIERLLGKGSMARVYQARQVSLRRHVALKVLEESLFTPHENIKRFLREAEAMARLEHPHIVPVYTAGEATPYYYFAMRLIRGGSLNDAMHSGIQRGLAIRWAYEICQALAYAHEQGVVHRDLKPSNVLIQEDVAVLADFGLARLRDMSTITQSGLLLGTPWYMSPEQTQGEEAGAPSDCFSMAAILYEMLFGRHPFAPEAQRKMSRIEAQVELFRRIQRGDFVSPAKLDPALPPTVEHIIKRGLQPKIDERYPDGASMLRDLQVVYNALPGAERVVRTHKHAGESGSGVAVSKPVIDSTVDMAPADSPVPTPALTRFGRYEIRKEIGHGGQGVVYHAYDGLLEREVALKVLQPDAADGASLTQLLAHEAKMAARLEHPHIIQVYDYGVEGQRPYLTMPYVDGPSLDRLLNTRKPLPLCFALTVLTQSAQALDFAHKAGVIHLDVKPGNILVGRATDEAAPEAARKFDPFGKPHVRLTDFTMAALHRANTESQRTHSRKPDLPAGTVPYASPEQLDNDPNLGPASDIFSLGIVLFEMLTGARLFAADNLSVTQLLVMRGRIPPPSSRAPDLPHELDDLCQRMLARKPAERLASAEEVVAIVRPVLERALG